MLMADAHGLFGDVSKRVEDQMLVCGKGVPCLANRRSQGYPALALSLSLSLSRSLGLSLFRSGALWLSLSCVFKSLSLSLSFPLSLTWGCYTTNLGLPPFQPYMPEAIFADSIQLQTRQNPFAGLNMESTGMPPLPLSPFRFHKRCLAGGPCSSAGGAGAAHGT